MSTTHRFQVHSAQAEQGGIVTSAGVDPLTGLPVLIYTFPGRPAVGVGVLESENIPGILSADFDGERGRIVTAYSRDYDLVAPGEAALTADFAGEAARALRDAAAAGVVHGDLRPGRILHADGHVLIEGYGVPWSARGRDFTPPEYDGESSYAGDVYSFAKALLHLGRHAFPRAVVTALDKALLPNPEMRPSADELLALLERARGERAARAALAVAGAADDSDDSTDDTTGGAVPGFDTITLAPAPEAPRTEVGAAGSAATSDDVELEFDVDFEPFDRAAEPETPAAPQQRAEPQRAEPQRTEPPPPLGSTTDPDPIEIATDPDPDRMRLRRKQTHEDRSGFVKELPPGATYRSGDLRGAAPPAAFTFEEDAGEAKQRRRMGRLFLLGLTLVAVTVAAALLLPRRQGFVGPSQGTIFYTVGIGVEPPTVPRMDLITVRSPAGSSYGPGDVLDFVPGQVLLDAEGVWVLQGRFGERLTEPVELEVPAQRNATLVLPELDEEDGTTP